jgi:hypothetical protein
MGSKVQIEGRSPSFFRPLFKSKNIICSLLALAAITLVITGILAHHDLIKLNEIEITVLLSLGATLVSCQVLAYIMNRPIKERKKGFFLMLLQVITISVLTIGLLSYLKVGSLDLIGSPGTIALICAGGIPFLSLMGICLYKKFINGAPFHLASPQDGVDTHLIILKEAFADDTLINIDSHLDKAVTYRDLCDRMQKNEYVYISPIEGDHNRYFLFHPGEGAQPILYTDMSTRPIEFAYPWERVNFEILNERRAFELF